jgi:hypothetical protein
MSIALKCSCGKVKGRIGEVSRIFNARFVCLCADCQAFAVFLGNKTMLDSNGGSEVVPIHPAKLEITDGADQLACIRLSDDGIRRWYTACCKTPVANVIKANWPFAGVHKAFMDFRDEVSREEALGPVVASVNSKYGIPPFPREPKLDAAAGVSLRALFFLLYGFLLRLNRPSPFPRLQPPALSDEQYFKLIEQTGPKKGAIILENG